MARTQRRPAATSERVLELPTRTCSSCGTRRRVAYHRQRTVATLAGVVHLRLKMERCRNPTCALFKQTCAPEAAGAIALPHSEFGLDVLALVGALRYREHRSVPELHQTLTARGLV